MAKQFNDGTRVVQNLIMTSGAEAIWSLVKLLVNAAGYTLDDSDDANGNPVDMVTYQGTGGGGLDRADAWLLFTDPGGVRQYLFVRKANHYTWWILMSETAVYPAAVHPNPPAAAADETSLWPGAYANPDGDPAHRTSYDLFPNPMNHRVHCWCDDAVASDSDVYSFGLWTAQVGTGTEATCLFVTARVGEGGVVTPGDPSSAAVYYCNLVPPTYSNALSTPTFAGWPNYPHLVGKLNGEKYILAARYDYDSTGAMEPVAVGSPNPVTGRYALLPMFIRRGAGVQQGDAGMLWPGDIHWNPSQVICPYGTYFDDEGYGTTPTADHLHATCQDVAFAGWYSNVIGPLS